MQHRSVLAVSLQEYTWPLETENPVKTCPRCSEGHLRSTGQCHRQEGPTGRLNRKPERTGQQYRQTQNSPVCCRSAHTSALHPPPALGSLGSLTWTSQQLCADWLWEAAPVRGGISFLLAEKLGFFFMINKPV